MNWAQLRGMLWLRWRLTRNQWRRGGEINAAITLIVVICALGMAVIGGVVGVAVGALGLSQASPTVNLIVWDALAAAFLLFWTVGVLTELQKSDILDLSRLLLLPISLRDVFLLNYVSSHFSLSLALVMPAMLGLAIGLVFGRSVSMLLVFPLVVGFFFMITAWTYCLRGWLASLMINKRRRRAIIMGLTMTFVLLAQLPNLLTNVWMRGEHEKFPQTPAEVPEWNKRQAEKQAQQAERRTQQAAIFERVHHYVPPMWLANGVKSLAEGRVWPAIWGAFGMFAIGAWGLAHAYHSTLRFYLRGGTSQAAPKPAAEPSSHAGGRLLVERIVPGVPEEAGAMALASLRSMLRAPEVKMSLATNVAILMFLSAGLLVSRAAKVPDGIKPFAACGAAAIAMMGLGQLMFNHFGFDRAGFRALVLIPTPRRYILLGKTLAVLPVGLAVFAIYLVLATFVARLGPWDIMAGVVEFLTAFLVMSVLGNLASIIVPYRIAAGSLKPTKIPFMSMLLIILVQMLSPLTMLPVFLPAGLGLLVGHFGWLPAGAVTLACAVLFAALAALIYWLTLEPFGRLLQKREKRILEVVTQEVE